MERRIRPKREQIHRRDYGPSSTPRYLPCALASSPFQGNLGLRRSADADSSDDKTGLPNAVEVGRARLAVSGSVTVEEFTPPRPPQLAIEIVSGFVHETFVTPVREDGILVQRSAASHCLRGVCPSRSKRKNLHNFLGGETAELPPCLMWSKIP